MTTRERILVLADAGDYLQLIAARLGLTDEQVERTLSDPTYTPPELSMASADHVLGLLSSSNFTAGVVGALVQFEESDSGLQSPIITTNNISVIPPGGVVIEEELIGPVSGVKWTYHLNLVAINLGTSEVGTYTAEKDLKQGGLWSYLASADLTPHEAPEDLVLDDVEVEQAGVKEPFSQLKSTAGGVFFTSATWKFSLAA